MDPDDYDNMDDDHSLDDCGCSLDNLESTSEGTIIEATDDDGNTHTHFEPYDSDPFDLDSDDE